MKELIYIEWCDAMTREIPWVGESDIIKWADTENWVVSEVGFVIKETKEYLLIANKRASYDKDNPEYGGVMKIPTTWIRKRVNLESYI